MTKEELRKKFAAAFMDWVSSGGLSKFIDAVPLDELPADTIEFTLVVKGIPREDPRVIKSTPSTFPMDKGPMLVLGVNTLVDGKDPSEQKDDSVFAFLEVTPAEKA